MENAKGEQFIRNGFERPGIDRLTRDPVLNKSVPFFALIWMRRYSSIVFALVIVQIALSLLNVDWTENARHTNPIYMNLLGLAKQCWVFLLGL